MKENETIYCMNRPPGVYSLDQLVKFRDIK